MISKKRIFFLISILICSVPLFLTFNRGINYFDEGYILEGARKILAGAVPYKDFHFIYTPLSIYLLALFLKIGGNYVIIERFGALALSLFGIGALGLLTEKITKNSLISFFSMFLYTLWGPTHINFIWPVMIVLPFVFFYLYLFSSKHFFLAGMVMGVVLICKHNLGAALIISCVGYCVLQKNVRRQGLFVLSGFMSVLGVFTLYLALSQSLFPFFADMNRYTIQAILVRQSFSVPFPTDSLAKFLLYSAPGIASLGVAAFLFFQKKTKELLYIPLTTGALYFLAIFPTPDWTHLLPLLGLLGILIALIPAFLGQKSRVITYLIFILVISVAGYSALRRNYYRWEAPLTQHTNCFSQGVMKWMCLDGKNFSVITETLSRAQKETQYDSAIFTYYNDPIFYFLLQKNNPTPYNDFNVAISKDEEEGAIAALEQEKVNIVITRFGISAGQAPRVGNYIISHFTPLQNSFEFVVWKRKGV